MLTYSFELSLEDVERAFWVVHGGRRKVWNAAVGPACAGGFFALVLLLGLTLDPLFSFVAALVAGGAIWALLCRRWFRAYRASFRSASVRPLYGRRQVSLTSESIDNIGDAHRSWFTWPLVTRAFVNSDQVVICTANAQMIVIPCRAVKDRPALVAHLRSVIAGTIKVTGCANCGYDIFGAPSTACPECGALNSRRPPN